MIQPLQDVRIDPLIAALPKADLHIHQEEVARLERIIVRRQHQTPHDWRESARRLIAETPPGIGRLSAMYAPDAAFDLRETSADG
ncbi:MAG: hypothetical protein P8183_20685, partial [Anaerolineae bacterium]